MGGEVAERRLESALAEQARLTRRYQQSVGTTGEFSAYAQLQAATLAVNNCDRVVRAPPRRDAARPASWARDVDKPTDISERFDFAVLRGLDGPRAARAEVARRVRGLVDDEVVDTVELLVSETVTNAVTHGAASGIATVGLRGRLSTDRLRVEVSNAGQAFDHVPACPSALEPDGRGLFLVDTLSRAWGTEHARGHTSVWFEVDRKHGSHSDGMPRGAALTGA